MSKVSRLEVLSTGARRRWTLAEKIVLNCGHRVVVDKGVDATALARVLSVLVRR